MYSLLSFIAYLPEASAVPQFLQWLGNGLFVGGGLLVYLLAAWGLGQTCMGLLSIYDLTLVHH